ncbi:MAG: alpha/beta fold hydrolase, partial [Halobacteria archaeon]|nr:alpha/beta fold hydrolase [Halobacteria archaeon]
MNHGEWSASQDETDVIIDGHDLNVAYRDEGSGHAPVVFLHGIPTWSFLWRDVATAIEEDRRVIVPDLLGYGNSSMHDGFDRSIRAQEIMLDSLLRQLGTDRVN